MIELPITRLWFWLSPYTNPYLFSLNEDKLKEYLTHLHEKGTNGYSYELEKQRGYIQYLEVPEKKWKKIQSLGVFYMRCDPEGMNKYKVIAISNTMTDLAREVTQNWGEKISAKQLSKLGNHRLNFREIEESAVMEMF